jgi:MoaA/NifB/PqqE/SkfB family radical SAM enzyme
MMRSEIIERVIKELSDASAKPEIVLAGIGEPLLHPDWRDFVSTLKDTGISLTIHTNGALLSDADLYELIEKKTDRICFSIDPEGFGHPHQEKTIEVLRRLNDIKKKKNAFYPSISVESVICSANIASIEPFISKLQNEHVAEWTVSHLVPITEEQSKNILYAINTPYHDLSRLEELSYRFSSHTIPSTTTSGIRKCRFIEKNSLVVSSEGAISPCYPLLHDYSAYIFGHRKRYPAYAFGHYPEESLYTVWQKPILQEFRTKAVLGLFPFCFDCDLMPSCSLSEDSLSDCQGHRPTCADCLWYYNFVSCI